MKSVASLILLAIMLCILIVVIRIYKRLMSEKTAMEKDAEINVRKDCHGKGCCYSVAEVIPFAIMDI